MAEERKLKTLRIPIELDEEEKMAPKKSYIKRLKATKNAENEEN